MSGPKTQKSAELKLQKFIDKYNLSDKLSVEEIKKWVYEEKGHGLESINLFQKKIIECFDEKVISQERKINEVLDVMMDVWNFFPHKSLGGKSPNEMVMQSVKDFNKAAKQIVKQEVDTGAKNMPDIICGGQKMKWDDYWAMIKEMEKRQEPFKNWVEKEVLPKYEKFLTSAVVKNKKDDYYAVADSFFNRALNLGFIEFNQIRIDFIHKEFPHWFPTHVLFVNLTKKEILEALKKLFEFLNLVFDIDIKKFGF